MNSEHIIGEILTVGMTVMAGFTEPGVGRVVVFWHTFASEIAHPEFVLRVFVTCLGGFAIPLNGNLIMVFEIAAEGSLATSVPSVDL